MLVFTFRFAQEAAIVRKVNVSPSIMQQIVYKPVNVPSCVRQSGIKSWVRLRSLADASRLTQWALGCGVCIYTYPGGTPSIWEPWDVSLSSGSAGDMQCSGGIGCGRGTPGSLHLQHVHRYFTGPFWQIRQLSIWFSRTIARCHAIKEFTLPGREDSTPPVFHSQTLIRGILIV